jgi:hypothetical protein
MTILFPPTPENYVSCGFSEKLMIPVATGRRDRFYSSRSAAWRTRRHVDSIGDAPRLQRHHVEGLTRAVANHPSRDMLLAAMRCSILSIVVGTSITLPP